jgi:microcystin-dependent protein
MAEPFIAEIRPFAFNYAPKGWAFCQGQLLAIAQNTALFSLIGTFYGGNGVSTFQLPNLQGRVPMHQGPGPGLTPRTLGETGGTTSETLLLAQIPAHIHAPACSSAAANDAEPTDDFWAADLGGGLNYAPSGAAQMAPDALQPVGGGQPHTNMQATLAINYCIALQGVFPQRS